MEYGLLGEKLVHSFSPMIHEEFGDYNYELIDTKNRKFDIYYDGEKTHILNYESRNLDITKLRDIVSIRYNFYKENEIEIKNAYKA